MQFSKAIAAGIVGAAAMTIVMAVARFMGMPVNLEMLLGSTITRSVGPGVWALGLVMHLLAGAILGCIYALLFEHLAHRANTAIGALIGVVHGVISGLLLGLVPAVHPLVPETLGAPGVFMVSLGVVGVVAFIVLHITYGAIVGAYYKPILLKNQRLIPAA